MRDILYDRGKGVKPGDRGSSSFKYMTPLHYIVEEFENQDASDQSPYLFAFDRSRRVREKDLAYRLYRVFASLRKKNRRNDEVEQGHLRQLILLTLDAEPVKTALLQLGLEWLAEPNVQIWNLKKKKKQFETRLQRPAVFEHVLERLGIRFQDTRFGKLTSCSGNATVFMIQMILAFFYRDERQKALFDDRRPLRWLRYTWIIEHIITVTDNRVADKNIAYNKVINDKSTDDKMAENKMAGGEASDNKSNEKITPEKKATEGENTEETSKDDEMTDAQHSDGQSAEDEIVKLSVIRQHLSAEMPDLFFNVFSKEGLGLPSQYCYPSAYDWLKKIIWKFHKKIEKADSDDEGTQSLTTLQFACIRFRCAACRGPCQDDKTMEPIKGHAGLLFPCGHIIGDSCYDALLDNFKSSAMPPERLWAMCGPLHGIEEDDFGILTRAKRFTDKLEGRVTENVKVLQRLLEETPGPIFSEKDKNGGVILGRDLEYYIADFDYFVEVEDGGNGESDTMEEEDGHDSDYELPRLKDSSHTTQREENTQ
ncbi:hypothetical protein FACUT_694 [Fusarium acutatum]|uniref:Uncharacterized protein n=1 Tax=Fusarium acutatum TaxID=78861 RepID=A0A8H4K446_9HYPO|nr:hypothetical protein FACUT_694 [Fusarium acutatum]